METITQQRFRDTRITVDGRHFMACQFENVVLVYAAGAMPSFSDCTFEQVALDFEGPARNTLRFLSSLQQQGGFGTSVVAFFNAIRAAQEDDTGNQ